MNTIDNAMPPPPLRPWQRTLKLRLTDNEMNTDKPLPLPVNINDINDLNDLVNGFVNVELLKFKFGEIGRSGEIGHFDEIAALSGGGGAP